MWVSIGLFLISFNLKLITEPEQLVFVFVILFILLTFSLIIKVYLTIQNQKIIHQIMIDRYLKMVINLNAKFEKESLNETSFNLKQKVLINDVFEVKNQCISLKLIMNSLKNK